MADPKVYREIAVADLPDSDWVASQAVLAGVLNVYSQWPGRACIEVVPVWWKYPEDVAVYDTADVEIQPVEVKRLTDVDADFPGSSPGVPDECSIVCAATTTISGPAFVKQSLVDTSPDEMYLRVAAATAPGDATHLRLVVEVTP